MAFNRETFSNIWSEFKGQISRALNKDGDVMEGDLQLGTDTMKDSSGETAVSFDINKRTVCLYGHPYGKSSHGSFDIEFSNNTSADAIITACANISAQGKTHGVLYVQGEGKTLEIYSFSSPENPCMHMRWTQAARWGDIVAYNPCLEITHKGDSYYAYIEDGGLYISRLISANSKLNKTFYYELY